MSGDNFVRSVGGRVVSSIVTGTSSMRIERIRRESDGRRWHWHFRQPELCLFWFGNGPGRLRATIDGRSVSYGVTDKSRLCLFPARTEIEGEWTAGPTADYTVVFLKPDFVEDRLKSEIDHPIVGFDHVGLERGLAELCREAASPDNVFDLLAEGWSIQALAQMARVSRNTGPAQLSARGGLSSHSVKLVDDYIRANLSGEMTLQDLAAVAGLSKRHFHRAFQDSFGTTPHRYILSLRIEDAKLRLSQTGSSVTEIALTVVTGPH